MSWSHKVSKFAQSLKCGIFIFINHSIEICSKPCSKNISNTYQNPFIDHGNNIASFYHMATINILGVSTLDDCSTDTIQLMQKWFSEEFWNKTINSCLDSQNLIFTSFCSYRDQFWTNDNNQHINLYLQSMAILSIPLKCHGYISVMRNETKY